MENKKNTTHGEGLISPVARLVSPVKRLASPVKRLGPKPGLQSSQEVPYQIEKPRLEPKGQEEERPARVMVNQEKQKIFAQPQKVQKRRPRFYCAGGYTVADTGIEKVELFAGKIEIRREILEIQEKFDETGKITGYNENSLFSLEIVTKKGSKSVLVNLEAIYDGKFLQKESKGRVILEPGAKVKNLYQRYVRELINRDDFGAEYRFNSIGWKNYRSVDGSFYFVTPNGVIGNPDLAMYAKSETEFGSRKMYAGTSVAKAFISMREILPEDGRVAIVMQLYFILALCRRLLMNEGLPLQFLLAIIGETNARKTTLAKLFFRLMDRSGGPDIKFESTVVALEEAMAKNTDAVTIFDDLVPPVDRAHAKELMKKLEVITRSYGDNVGKKRSKIFATLNQGVAEYTPITSMAVVTGEQLPVEIRSSRARILKLEISRDSCELDKLSWHQEHLEILPTFVCRFLEFTTNNQKSLMARAKEVFEAHRRDLSLPIDMPRFRETYAMLKVASYLLSEYLAFTGHFSRAEIEENARIEAEAIKSVIQENDSDAMAKPDEQIIAEIILEEFEHQCAIEDVKDILKTIHGQDDFYIIYPSRLLEMLKSGYARKGKFSPFSTQIELTKFLAKKELIQIKSEGSQPRYTHKTFAHTGIHRRFYELYKIKLENLIS